MKLSEKGYLKIGNSIFGWLEDGVAKVTFDPDKIEFDQSDFEGMVCLTLDEAKELIDLLSHAEDQRQQPYSYDACDAWERILGDRYGESK